MKSYTHLIFDLGNTVLTDDWLPEIPGFLSEISANLSALPETVNSNWNTPWQDFFRGLIDEDEYWRRLAKACHSSNPDITAAKLTWRKFQSEKEHMLSLLARLKTNNYRLIAFTTISREWLNFKRLKFSLDFLFENIVASCDYFYAKPDIEIYEILVSSIDALTGNCVFIDNTPHNLLPAEKLGMKTILFSSQSQLETDLTSIGVKI
jgi:2-haloacid dehalogenase